MMAIWCAPLGCNVASSLGLLKVGGHHQVKGPLLTKTLRPHPEHHHQLHRDENHRNFRTVARQESHVSFRIRLRSSGTMAQPADTSYGKAKRKGDGKATEGRGLCHPSLLCACALACHHRLSLVTSLPPPHSPTTRPL